jgi:membrane protease YdiL (CAAX protease family)
VPLAIGSLVPVAAGLGAAEGLSRVLEPNDLVERVYGRVTPDGAVPFVLFIAIVPGLVEELLFRGYIQRRLLRRWPGWAAVLVASGLFGAMHLDPHTAVFAFVVGVWLGAAAWRTGSVWPGVVCHAFINATSSVYLLGTRFGHLPDPLPDSVTAALATLALTCFVASVWLLFGRSVHRDAERDGRPV